ncbi:MAG: peptidylprolyl isomerase [Chlamydiota bacterium]
MKRYTMCAVLGACAAAVALAGCGEKGTKAVSGGEAVALVNDTAIPRAEVDRLTDAFMKQFGSGISAEQRASIKGALGKQALDNLINQKLLVQEAERKGISADPKAVEAQMAKFTQMFPDPGKLKEQLSAMGVTEDELKRDVAQNLKIKALIEKQVPEGQEPTKKEIEEFYKANPQNFDVPERVQASHILLATAPGDTPEKKAEKKAALAAIREKIVKGADFAQCAKESSDCPSKSRGGDLGLFEKGKMAPEFEKAAFSMKKGELSQVVETSFGYHLIKVTDRKEPEKSSLEKASEQIRTFLSQQKKGKGVQEYLAKLRASAKISYPSPEFQPAAMQPAPGQAAAPGAPQAAPRTIRLAPPKGQPEQPAAKAGSPAGAQEAPAPVAPNAGK